MRIPLKNSRIKNNKNKNDEKMKIKLRKNAEILTKTLKQIKTQIAPGLELNV